MRANSSICSALRIASTEMAPWLFCVAPSASMHYVRLVLEKVGHTQVQHRQRNGFYWISIECLPSGWQVQ